MTRIVCRSYGSGIFHGLEFTETEVDGLLVGVAFSDDPEAIARFQGRPAFAVEPQERAGSLAPEPEQDSAPVKPAARKAAPGKRRK